MVYIAFIRGINVGKSIKISKQQLHDVFQKCGFTEVFVYINSGNVVFKSTEKLAVIEDRISTTLFNEIGAPISFIIKMQKDLKEINTKVPSTWTNDELQRTDVVFLFPEINNKEIISNLPINQDYVNLIYTNGAIIWNISRENYSKSRLNKIISHSIYQHITIRNINTVRYLAEYKE